MIFINTFIAKIDFTNSIVYIALSGMKCLHERSQKDWKKVVLACFIIL
jgi:hypothetical protein